MRVLPFCFGAIRELERHVARPLLGVAEAVFNVLPLGKGQQLNRGRAAARRIDEVGLDDIVGCDINKPEALPRRESRDAACRIGRGVKG